MKKYNFINNSLGWLCFAIAAVTYLLTIEPTASFWDCPEFISQGYKLEVGHPPGNPIFILTARFFINFVGGDVTKVAMAVNVMSALLSAGTILLLFWTITHFMRRLLVGRSMEEISLPNTILIMASGLVGALLYTWSDTFWYSAVEGEVYAFSSFCTALVVWLALKWENRADQPHSDRYIILIAYVIGISIAVHLLNLLTIPALALVFYFRKAKNVNVKGLAAIVVASFLLITLILFGLVPGFIENAQYFELFFVNTLGMSYNLGVLVYALLMFGSVIWTIYELYAQKSIGRIRVSFLLAVVLSGIPLIGNGWVIPVIFILGLGAYLFFAKKLYVRPLLIAALSILVIFVGYSSYALILIRANANPPMNQNSPDNVFVLGSYLNREQYGQTPLLYGQAFTSKVKYVATDETNTKFEPLATIDHSNFSRVVKNGEGDADRYVEVEPQKNYDFEPKMFFPRMYSGSDPRHVQGYQDWIGESMDDFEEVEIDQYYDMNGNALSGEKTTVKMPSFTQNMRYFLDYQLGYMYWRYFMWNFAGRQNDLQGQGEVTRGNWISGIPFIDNARLGDQSLLPDELGSANKGHNVFYMLPLLLGLLGIVAQLLRGETGVKQFWVVFLLFFMTGIAIVLYLNQPPNQPRERDYAFAGSFYAFSIWIGLGVYTLWRGIVALVKLASSKKKAAADESGNKALIPVIAAAVLGLIVPIQMVSQTWDDHDRSDRYTARDYGMNYLSSLDENAIIFTCGDNDTFPLWYAQEVEGYRTDVRVVNLAYLSQDWYANHALMPSYNALPVNFSARPIDYAYDRLNGTLHSIITSSVPRLDTRVTALRSLQDVYTAPDAVEGKSRVLRYGNMYIPTNLEAARKTGFIGSNVTSVNDIPVDWNDYKYLSAKNGQFYLSDLLSLDIIATSAQNGWDRPVYFAMTVPNDYYLNLENNLASTGLAYQVTPFDNSGIDTEKSYNNVMTKFRWGGLDDTSKDVYLDDATKNMVSTHRVTLLRLANALYEEGVELDAASFDEIDGNISDEARDKFEKARDILLLIEEKLPTRYLPYTAGLSSSIIELYYQVGVELGDKKLIQKARDIAESEINRFAQYIPYYKSLLRDLRKSSPGATIFDLKISGNDELNIPYYLVMLLNSYNLVGGDTTEIIRQLEKRYPGFYNDLSDFYGQLVPEDDDYYYE